MRLPFVPIVVGPASSLVPAGDYSRGWPATCRECGALAYDRPHGFVRALHFLSELLAVPILVLVWARFPRFFSVIAVFTVAFFIYSYVRKHSQPCPATTFRPISPASSRLSRRLTYLAILVVVALVVVSVGVATRFR